MNHSLSLTSMRISTSSGNPRYSSSLLVNHLQPFYKKRAPKQVEIPDTACPCWLTICSLSIKRALKYASQRQLIQLNTTATCFFLQQQEETLKYGWFSQIVHQIRFSASRLHTCCLWVLPSKWFNRPVEYQLSIATTKTCFALRPPSSLDREGTTTLSLRQSYLLASMGERSRPIHSQPQKMNILPSLRMPRHYVSLFPARPNFMYGNYTLTQQPTTQIKANSECMLNLPNQDSIEGNHVQ